jgi:hypothetical protein
MDCPACRQNEQSNPLVFQFGEIDNIPGDMETVDEPAKYPTNAKCSFDEDHFYIVEVNEEEDSLTLIMEAQAPMEDDVYEFLLSDFEYELS